MAVGRFVWSDYEMDKLSDLRYHKVFFFISGHHLVQHRRLRIGILVVLPHAANLRGLFKHDDLMANLAQTLGGDCKYSISHNEDKMRVNHNTKRLLMPAAPPPMTPTRRNSGIVRLMSAERGNLENELLDAQCLTCITEIKGFDWSNGI